MYVLRAAIVALGCFLGACGLDLGTEEQALTSCPNWACAQNGPTLNNRDFHELAETGEANAEGFRLGPMVKNNQVYTVRVVGHQLYGVASGSTLSGSALVGASFYVVDSESRVTRIYINGVALFPIWGGPHKGEAVESYRFEWTDQSADRLLNLCANPSFEKPQSSELLGMKGDYTLVFEGNRYDAKRKVVLPGDRNWFNLGCAGHALSKLFLTGHTNNSGQASVEAQQATLKMLTADYCGDGTPFTVGGEPLYWKTSNTYMKYFQDPKTLEARWDAKGATCINQPRLKVTTNPVALALYPDISAAIDAQCAATRPPQCANTDFTSFDNQLVVSGNPINE